MMRAVLDAISLWAMPVLLVAIPLVGIIRGVKVYDVFIEGAKEGFNVAIRIIRTSDVSMARASRTATRRRRRSAARRSVPRSSACTSA